MASWASQAREETAPKDPERSLQVSKTMDDRYVLNGSLDGEGEATVAAALRLAGGESRGGDDDRRSPATRRADAFVDIARFFLDHQRSHPGGRHRTHVNVVVNLEDLAARQGGRVVDGPALDATSISKLLCDCALHRVVMAGGSAILDYGRSTRTIPTPLWNAVVIRDDIVLLCSRHHHRLHQPDWPPHTGPRRRLRGHRTDRAGAEHLTTTGRAGLGVENRRKS